MNPREFKKAFFDRVGNMDQLLPLLDSLQDTSFFFKDRQSRQVMNNQRAVASSAVKTEEETIGKIGYEFWNPEKVATYLMQDEKVMQTGKPMINALCTTPEKGSDTAIVVSKIPLFDKEGKVIGLAGVWRESISLTALPPQHNRLSAIVKTMHNNYAEHLLVEDMAAEVGMSRSQFGRIFRKTYGLSARDYLTSVRVNAAALLLRSTQLQITEIALQTGFYDHSHFSRLFKSVMSMPPTDYRRRHSS